MKRRGSEGGSGKPPRVDGAGGVPADNYTPWSSGNHEPATVIVLAGGNSTRMGVDKSLLPFLGRPLIQHVCEQVAPHFDELLIAAGAGRKFDFLDAPVVCDELPKQGPLQAIASALAVSRHDLNFVMACDIPWVNVALLRDLLRGAKDCDCVVPITADGHYEPLFAVYRKSALPGMRQALQDGERRAAAAFRFCRMRTVPVPAESGLDNINTIEDYRRLLRSAELREQVGMSSLPHHSHPETPHSQTGCP